MKERNVLTVVDNLIDQAWEALDATEQRGLARQALTLDPSAIDGYVILALRAEIDAERIALLREAILWGEALWREYVGRPPRDFFWAHLETRPFMRALHNLALVLWARGDREEAVRLADRMLRLNPNDNQGIRYIALAWHPVLSNWSRVEKLLRKYRGEVSTEYLYAHCLSCVRRGVGAEEALDAAMAVNPHVPAMLLSPSPRLLDQTSNSITYGSEEEAAAYAAFNLDAWASVPTALEWLRGAIRRSGL